MIEEITKQIGNNTYHCITAGKGEPLVLLHGFTGTSDTWLPFIERWASAFRVIAIDLPGHGKTETPDFPNMVEFCDELAEILHLFSIKKCDLLGYSMGGRVALSFSKRHPDYVESLLLESASPGLRTEAEREQRRKKDQQLADKIATEGISAFVEMWENLPLFTTQKNLPENIKQQVRKERLFQTEAGLAKSLQWMGTGAQPSWWDQLNSLHMPVYLIVGNLDKKFVEINQAMEKGMTQSELVIVHEAGHAVHVEQAEKFATIVMEFLYLKNT
ncbi:MAG TPA: 2-succinyl-6-hydroxy-2,4-cyclohexadiene-1-carboxylate synthase [Pseudogracilibacillus sp.]|nr:2-succinyl-6-hydroxy-2,4-cyclohexadiene-1-carboxylate synthase [Pseudogracilibacillus sp.]